MDGEANRGRLGGQDLIRTIHEIFVSEDSPFRNERNLLVSDVMRRDLPDKESVLDAVSSGNHGAESIALAAGLNSQRSAQILRVRYMRKRDTGRSAS